MSLQPTTIDLRDTAEIERIFAPVFARHANVRLKLFGSRARGDARRASDIDIALNSPEAIPAAELAALRDTLERSRIPFRIDLVDYATAPPELRTAIDREGIAWPA
jgi:predicted nucleotidyltransferase